MFWFLIFNSFDATYLFEYTFMMLYNLVFTSLPVGVLGAFDQDTNAAASMAFPQLYKRGIQGLDYTRRRFWLYMTDGLYQSAVIFFIPFLVYGSGVTWASNGQDTNSLWDLGTTVAVAGVFSANLYVGINLRYWTVLTWIIIVGSSILILLWIPIYSYLAPLPYYATVSVIYPTFNFWMTIVVTVFIAIGPAWLLRVMRQAYFPRDKDIIREAWIAGSLKDELGLKHRSRRKARKAAAMMAKRSGKVVAEDPELESSENGSPETRPAYLEPEAALTSAQNVQRAWQEERFYGHGQGNGDGRGTYERAAIASPQALSPVPTGTPAAQSPVSTYRTAASHPISPTGMDDFGAVPYPAKASFVKPPLNRNPSSSDPSAPLNPGAYNGNNGTNPSQRRYAPHLQPPQSPHTPDMNGNRFSGVMDSYEYHSPSALDRFNMAQSEIDRMSGASRDLKRASLTSRVADEWREFGGSNPGTPAKRTSSLSTGWRRSSQWGSMNSPSRDAERSHSLNTPQRPSRPSRSPGRLASPQMSTPAGDGSEVEMEEVVRRDRGVGGQEGHQGQRESYIDFSSPQRWSMAETNER